MELRIDRRYRGPLTSANGGYACGLLAGVIGGAVEVTLRRPPPLEVPLRVVPGESGTTLLLEGDALVAEARTADPALDVPDSPGWDAAVAATRGAEPGWGSPDFAECFVCGHRADGSGLELHARPVAGTDLVAAPWVAHDVSLEVVWAAIDCPGAYAVGAPGRGEPVLGRMTARVDRLPVGGERCVVIGWPLGTDGRKHHAGTALIDEDGVVLARARQVWIEPRG